ncbi:MAG: hypothetical protein P8182_15490 [Deltaproteobacteria bacterium]
MNDQAKGTIGISLWGILFIVASLMWGAARGDPYAMLLTVLRIFIVVPLATGLSIGSLILFDKYTPGDWLAGVADDQHGNIGTKIGTGLVVASLIFSIFWVCVQG